VAFSHYKKTNTTNKKKEGDKMPTSEDYAAHYDGLDDYAANYNRLNESRHTGQPLEKLCWGCSLCGERGETVHNSIDVAIGMIKHLQQVEQVTHTEHLEGLSTFKVLENELLEKITDVIKK
jgi:hypothetical protein